MILQTDAAVCGGISEWRRIAAMAAGFGVSVCPHWFHDLHVHLVIRKVLDEPRIGRGRDQVLNFRRLVDTQLTLEKGRLRVPTGPGLGFRFDEKAVERYALDGWG